MAADRNDQESVMVTAAAAAGPMVNRPMSSLSFASASMARVPGSRRERLRSLARATQQVIKQEINKYYGPPSPGDTDPRLNNDFRSMSTVSSPGQDQKPALPPRPAVSASDTTYSNDRLNNSAAEPSNPIDTVKPYCMLFPTYACRTIEGDRWKMRLAGWTYALPGSSRLERWILAAGRSYGGLMANSTEDTHFVRLLNQFRCQTLRSVELKLSMVDIVSAEHVLSQQLPAPSDSHRKIKDHTRLHDKLHDKLVDKAQDIIDALSVNSGPTGRFEELMTLDLSHLLINANRKMLRLMASFDTIAESTPHDGFVDLIEPEGVSIISDIDDTIKVTNVPDGRDAILQNTFFKKADQVPGMAEVYRQWADQGVHVHYVSNSPWQVYPNLSDFILDQKFPLGSMHLRLISAADLIRKKASQHKIEVIPKILEDFPNRKFILIGDSGERDPEVYREIYDRYPHQIVKIFIHDVSSDRARRADQLEVSRSDSFYNSLRKFVSREQASGTPPHLGGSTYIRPHRNSTATSALMDAIGEADVPEQEKIIEDPAVPLKTKLDLFNERIATLSEDLPPGTFTLFSIASQLRTDPVVSSVIGEYASRKQQQS